MVHLLAHLIKRVTASTAGTQLKKVECEKCRTQFWYRLARTGTGASSSFMFVTNAARLRAHAKAKRNLARRLDREAELVPCPKCHWVNEELVRVARRATYRTAWLLIAFFLIMGWLAMLVLTTVASPSWQWSVGGPSVIEGWALGLGILLAAGVLPARSFLRQRIDPNRHYPNLPALPLGTPPALVGADGQADGDLHLQAVGVSYRLPPKLDGWAVLRPGQLVFPDFCCVCLTTTSDMFRPRFRFGASGFIALPFCAQCRRSSRKIWAVTALLTILGSTGAAFIIAVAIPSLDDTARWTLALILAIVGAVIGVAVIPNAVCRPYRFGMIDKKRGIMKLRAKHEEFTRWMSEQARRLDAEGASRETEPNYTISS